MNLSQKKQLPIQSYQKNGAIYYRFKIYLGVDPLTGKEKRTTRSGFKTLKEAELEYSRMQIQVADGTYFKNTVETYQDVYDLWVEQYKNTVEESTLLKTLSIFKNHILPAMGTYRISKITVEICQRHLNEWFKKLQSFRKVKAYASKIFDFAIKRNYVQSNPFNLVEMPKSLKRDFDSDEEEFENYYTADQLLTLLQCFEKEGNLKVTTLFRLLAYSGMHKGEALALQWKDINFKDNEIRINKAIARGTTNNLYVKGTKNGVNRTIAMDETTMQMLQAWKKEQRKFYLERGINTMNKTQLVFSTLDNKHLQPTKTREWLVRILKKYKLPKITTHGLRHTHCSLLFEAGVSIKQVQDRLGHTDVKTTMDIYAHVTHTSQLEAIEKLSKHLDASIGISIG